MTGVAWLYTRGSERQVTLKPNAALRRAGFEQTTLCDASALSSQSLSLSEAREENDRKDAEIERLKGLVAGIRECPQEPWQDIATAPKDGTVFFGIGPNDAYPQAMRWQAYSADEIEEIGEPGYWSYCEDLIGDVTGSASPQHWQPMFALPVPLTLSDAGSDAEGRS